MGKYIVFQTVTKHDPHIIPNDLLFYDRRSSVWPNELFPYCVNWYWGDFWWKHRYTLVKLRRFVEQQCNGDVCVVTSELPHAMTLYFEYEGDMTLVQLAWPEWLQTCNKE
jgi:hypothetical protein